MSADHENLKKQGEFTGRGNHRIIKATDRLPPIAKSAVQIENLRVIGLLSFNRESLTA